MDKNLDLYMVWLDEDDQTGYWQYYDSLEEAVSDNGDAEIFEAKLKSIGSYELKTSVIKKKRGK